MSVNTETKVHLYKIDGKETKVGENKSLNVRNVWNANKMVELQIGENGEKIEVHEEDLLKAISNAVGCHRY